MDINFNPYFQWEYYFGRHQFGPVGIPLTSIPQNTPPYIPYGPLPKNPITTMRYEPNGIYYYNGNWYDPLKELQPIHTQASPQPHLKYFRRSLLGDPEY
jgi:hypothetical protein